MAKLFSIAIAFRQMEQAAAGIAAAERQLVKTAPLLHAAGLVLLDAMRQQAPVGQDKVSYDGTLLHRGGTLQRSLIFRQGSAGAGVYGVDYADFVIHGTAPHLIMPVQKRALWWQGSAHPVSRVQHPGTQPNDFPLRAVEHARPALEVLMLENGRRLISLIARR
ncbi:MAG: hypothetical protein M1298_05335 [Chloroflexi bacterium]|nr:hypothetical protein [Chloroflexota bacterium]